MAAPLLNQTPNTAKWDQAIAQYDPSKPVMYQIPGGAGQPANIIDVNKLDENQIDELAQKFGPTPELTNRSKFLAAQREKDAALNAPPSEYEQYYNQAQGRATGLQEKLDQIFGDQAKYGTDLIDQTFAPERSRAISEEAALGRLTSLASKAPGSPIDRVDTRRGNAKTQLLSSLAGNRANAQTDIAKTIEQIFGNQQALGLSSDQFTKNYDLGKNQFQANINNAAANRAQKSDLARASLTHDTDMRTPSDWDRVTGQIGGGMDLFSKVFPMQAPGGEGGAFGGKKKNPSLTGDPASDKAFLSMLMAA